MFGGVGRIGIPSSLGSVMGQDGGGGPVPFPDDFAYTFDGTAPYFRWLRKDEAGNSVQGFLWNGVTYQNVADFVAAGGDASGRGGVSMPLTGMPSAYTVLVRGKAPSVANAVQNIAMALTDSGGTTGSNFVVPRFLKSGGSDLRIQRAGASQADIAISTDPLSGDWSCAFVVAANDARFYTRTVRTGTPDTSVIVPVVDRIWIGGGNAAGTEWRGTNNDGEIYEVTIWPAALKNSRLQALASGKRYGPTQAPSVIGQSGMGNGVLGPGMLVVGGYNYCGIVDSGGSQRLLVVEAATKQYTGHAFVSSTIGNPNQHDLPNSEITPGGKLLTVWAPHGRPSVPNIYWRRSTTTSPDDYAAEQTLNLGTGHYANYIAIHTHAATGNIYVLYQRNIAKIGVAVSTDDGVSFTDLGVLISFANDENTGDLFYWGAAWSDTNVLRVFCLDAFLGPHNFLSCAEYNVVTGDIQSGSGSVGTVGSDPADYTELSIMWYVVGSSLDRPVIVDGGQGIITQVINETTGTYDYWWASLASGSAFTAANWVMTFIAAGRPATAALSPRYQLLDPVAGKPRVLLDRCPDGATWQIEIWQANDAAGTSWFKAKTIVSGGNMTTDPIIDAGAPVPADGAVVFFERGGTYTDYSTWTVHVGWESM